MSRMTHGIGWFEVATDDPETVQRFYGSVFGWSFTKDDDETFDYRIVTTPANDSIRGGLFGTAGKMPNYAVFCIVVDDVAASCVSAETAGGKVLVPPQNGNDGLVFAHLLDPAGNHFAIYSPPGGQDS